MAELYRLSPAEARDGTVWRASHRSPSAPPPLSLSVFYKASVCNLSCPYISRHSCNNRRCTNHSLLSLPLSEVETHQRKEQTCAVAG